jgi:hypothetical protein
MRAKEFLQEDSGKTVTINIPITITIPSGNGDPIIGAVADPTNGELPPSPVNIFPLQQELELKKREAGKRSTVINQITSNDGAHSESDPNGKESTEFDVREDFDLLKSEFDRIAEAQLD